MIDLGCFEVDVQLMDNGEYDVWISQEGSSGSHYENLSVDEVGRMVAEEIECLAEEYIVNE